MPEKDNKEETPEDFLDRLVGKLAESLQNRYGPVEEMGISIEKYEELKDELHKIDDPVKRAHRAKELLEQFIDKNDIPDEFSDF